MRRKKLFGIPLIIILAVAGFLFRKQLAPLWEKVKNMFHKTSDTASAAGASVSAAMPTGSATSINAPSES